MKVLPVSRFTVNGKSMFPTLYEGQDVLIFNWAYLGKKPTVGDIVVIQMDGRAIIKRVKEVNGKQVFVVGDNSSESTDSRDFGPVGMDQVVGRVIYSSAAPQNDMVDCPNCGSPVIGIYGRKDAICKNCGFKLACCGEP